MAAIPGDPFSSFASSLGSGIGNGIGDAIGGGSAPLLSSASSATYGTTIGNDGWVINFGAGNQWASPVSSKAATYAPERPNPLTGLNPQQAGYGGSLAMLAVAAVIAIKFLGKG